MIIPHANAFGSEDSTEKTHNLWIKAARTMSLEYGIHVKVLLDYLGDVAGSPNAPDARIYFEVEDHKFGCLRDLRRALENKCFL
jgi:hypothetical protein